MVMEERYRAAKSKLEELNTDKEDLLKKISDVMNKVSESERLRAKAEENTKAITERKEALKMKPQEMKTAFVEKDAKLKRYMAIDDAKIQESYNQGQCNSIASVKPKVQQNLQIYLSKGWFAALDKMQVESFSSLRQEGSIPIPQELVIIPNLKIQAIINDESSIRVVEGASPVTGSGGEVTSLVVISRTVEPPQA